MMTKEEFAALSKLSGDDLALFYEQIRNFDHVAEVAMKVRAEMPGIGFVSVSQRLNCFMSVCRHLDSLTEAGEIDPSEAQMIMILLRLKDRRFLKAITMFEIRANRYGARERAEMPKTARQYLAQLQGY